MTNLSISFLSALAFLVLTSTPGAAQFAGGTGTPEDPFQVRSATHLAEMRNNLRAHYIQTADIDLFASTLSGRGWAPIGDVDNPFSGTYDGNGHRIQAMRINRPDEDDVGLFAAVSGTLKNIVLMDVNVTGNFRVGGITGVLMDGMIIGSYSTGNVTGTLAAGITGQNWGTVNDSYSTADVSGPSNLGGIAGQNLGTIARTYSAGSVSGDFNVGGLVGNNGGTIASSFWNTITSGLEDGVGTGSSAGVSGLTTARMKLQSSFEGFDFLKIWDIDEERTYPFLADLFYPASRYPGVDDEVFGGGAGTEDDPYRIGSADHLNDVRDAYLARNFIQTEDIDLDVTPYNSGQGWKPIGDGDIPFSGLYDGNGKVISNLMINRDDENRIGLFGNLARFGDPTGEVRNVRLQQVDVTGGELVGALVGLNHGTIDSSSSSGSVSGSRYIGGLVGIHRGTLLSNSFSTADVQGGGTFSNSGGLAGETSRVIVNSYAEGNVTGNLIVGGIAGSATAIAVIEDSYFSGAVSGSSRVGGVVGESRGRIRRSYVRGTVEGNVQTGGVAGREAGTVNDPFIDCYWDMETVGPEAGVGEGRSDGVKGLKTAMMTRHAVRWNMSGFDFDETWRITIGYPVLAWEGRFTTTPAQPFPGTGFPDDPYQVRNTDDFYNVRNYMHAHFIQTAFQLDLSDIDNWEPIGSEEFPFAGGYDGNGREIRNLTSRRTDEDNVGLFGYIEGATIQSVNLKNLDVAGRMNVGSLVGHNNGGAILNSTADRIETATVAAVGTVGGLVGRNVGEVRESSVNVDVSAETDRVGGLVGFNVDGSEIHGSHASGFAESSGGSRVGGLVGESRGNARILASSASGDVTSTTTGTFGVVGGLVGLNENSLVEESYATGVVFTSADYAGGLVARNTGTSRILRSYARGEVTGRDHVGGLAGRCETECEIVQSYATGSVSGQDTRVGGLLGSHIGQLSASYWDMQTSGIDDAVGAGSPAGATGLGTSEMTGWVSRRNMADFDFVNTWIATTGYPALAWENPGNVALPDFAGGSGTAADPFQIATAQHLYDVRSVPSAHSVQVADIDLSEFSDGEGWRPIGDDGSHFRGSYDGNGHRITGLFIDREGEDEVGLFSVVDQAATLRNIELTGVDILGNEFVGSLAGLNSGTIVNSHAEGDIRTMRGDAGGLVGLNSGTIDNSSAAVRVMGESSGFTSRRIGGLVGSNVGGISGSYASAEVSGRERVGGLAGWSSGTIEGSFASGKVSGEGGSDIGGLVGFMGGASGLIRDSFSRSNVQGDRDYVGGFVGLVGNNTQGIENSYASGSVRGRHFVGGFAGVIASGNTLTNCYATGNVEGKVNVGGFLGRNEATVIDSYAAGSVLADSAFGGFVGNNHAATINSYWNAETSGQDAGAGAGNADGLTGLTTIQMQQQERFEGWDFDEVWQMAEGEVFSYPYLRDNEQDPRPGLNFLIDFGRVTAETPKTMHIQVSNLSDDDLALQGYELLTGPADGLVFQDDLEAVIPAGDSRTFDVTWTPAAVGVVLDVLIRLDHDLPNFFTLSGTAVADHAAVVQLIHNAADPELARLDVRIEGEPLYEDLAFRSASGFIEVTAGGAQAVSVYSATGERNRILSTELSLQPSGRYQFVVAGVEGDGFAPNPDGADTGPALWVLDEVQAATSSSESVDLRLVHGVTDAPALTVESDRGAVLAATVSYGDASEYVSVDAANAVWELADANSRETVERFDVYVEDLAGRVVTVVLSGFAEPAHNPGGEGLQVLIVEEDGTVSLSQVATGSEEHAALPEAFKLSQNYPNPFNPATRIRYDVPERGDVRITIYDALGRRITTLVDEMHSPGRYDVTFDAAALPSGLYLYRMKAGAFRQVRRMVVVK